MHTLPNDRRLCRTNREARSLRQGTRMKGLPLLLLLGTMMLLACGGGSSNGGSQVPLTLSGNWQFTMSPQVDQNNKVLFLGGLQGGFLLQNNGSATGSAEYAVSFPGLLVPCNAGSAAVTGTISGQHVKLTAVAGTQTFTLTGVLSLYGSTMAGTYTSTAGTAPDGSACGSAEPPPGQNISGLQWSAALVPPITGTILNGSLLSMGGAAGLSTEYFPVLGQLTQGQNTGASSAPVTGTLNVTDYPCFDAASVYGQISGNSVTLQIVGTDESILGLIGPPTGSNGTTGLNPVTVEPVQNGYVLQGVGPSYLVATTACPGSLGNTGAAGDFGNICLALNGAGACQPPLTASRSVRSFPAQAAGSPLKTGAHQPSLASPSNRILDVEHHAEID